MITGKEFFDIEELLISKFYFYARIIDISLGVAIITLLATLVIFYHQNCKNKQHLCLNESIHRLESITTLIKSSFNNNEQHHELYSEFIFNYQLLKYSIKKFIKSAPYHYDNKFILKGRKRKEGELIQMVDDFIEFIDLETPIESPSNFNISNDKHIKTKKDILNDVNVRATQIIERSYELL